MAIVAGGGKAAKKYTAPKGAVPAPAKQKKIVVSQSVIDKIKSDGMTAALKKAGTGAVIALDAIGQQKGIVLLTF